jgi:hypothetical protein
MFTIPMTFVGFAIIMMAVFSFALSKPLMIQDSLFLLCTWLPAYVDGLDG